MSLINDALKKAQKLQTQQPAAPVVAPLSAPAPVVVRRGRSPNLRPIVLGAAALAVTLVGVVALTMLVMNKAPGPAPQKTPPSPAPTRQTPAAPTSQSQSPVVAVASPTAVPATLPSGAPSSPVAVAPPPTTPSSTPPPAAVSVSMTANAAHPPAPAVVSPPPSSTPAPSIAVAPSPTVSSAPEPAVVRPPVLTVPARATTVSAPVSPPAPAPAVPTAPRQNTKILTYLDALHVTGVRSAGAESKVLMNDRVYRPNDMVDYELGLRLTGIATTALTFVDDSGMVYTKTL